MAVYPLLAIGLAGFASSALLIRLASGDAPGLVIAAWRTLLAVVLLAPAAGVSALRHSWRFSGRDLLLILGAGVLLGLHFVMWIESIYLTSVASATVLVTTSPLFLALLGYGLLGERLSHVEIVGVLVATVGAVLIGWGDASQGGGSDSLLGNALALGASLVFSLYLIISRVVRRHTPFLSYTFSLYTLTSAFILAIVWVRGLPMAGFDTRFYLLVLLMAIGPQILGHGSFNFAIRYFSAAFLGLLSLLEPVGATIGAYFLFDEVPNWPARAGIFLVLVSVAIVIVRNQSERSRLRRARAAGEVE